MLRSPLDTLTPPNLFAGSEVSERAIERVVKLARGWLTEQLEQVSQVVERQAWFVVVAGSLATIAHQQGNSFIDQVAQKVLLKPDALTPR